MNKRRCGTCRFFQEAGLAGSGWCHHPQRRTTSNVMIMVRRNELACRDEWSHDLWAARGQDGVAPGTVAKQPMSIQPFPARRVPPATPTEIAAVVQADASTAEPPGGVRVAEDVLIGEARLVAEAEPDWTWERDDAAATREVDTRAAIIKAREAYRERARTTRPNELAETDVLDPAEATPTTGSPLDVGPTTDPPERATGVQPEESEFHGFGVEPSRNVESQSEEGWRGSDEGFDVVPERVPDYDLPRTRSVDRLRRRTSVGAPRRQPPGGPPPLPGRTGVDPGGVERVAAELSRRYGEPRTAVRPEWVAARPAEDGPSDRFPDELSVVGQTNDVRSFDGEPDRTAREEVGEGHDGGRRTASACDPPPTPIREVAERDEWSDHEAARLPDDRWDTDGEEGVGDPRPNDEVVDPPSVWSAAVEPVAPAGRDEPIELGVKVWSGLPRICRTCRDFRPAEGGGRGWCANEWAFTHRRVVDPAEAMPCETTLGSWWLPVDEVWLAAADVSEHGQPTPILDAVEAMGREEPLRQRR